MVFKGQTMKTLMVHLVLLMLICGGCTRFAAVKTFDDIRPNDALIFGRIQILRDGENVTKYSNVIFSQAGQNSWSSAQQLPLSTISDGVFSASLPAGDNYLFHLISVKGLFRAKYRYHFQPDEAILHLPQPGAAYYIGDITIDWTPPKSKSGKTAAFLMGGVVGLLLLGYTGGEAVITVQDNREEARTLFQKKFQTNKELIPAFLQLKTSQ
jgi:hypothetical protein